MPTIWAKSRNVTGEDNGQSRGDHSLAQGGSFRTGVAEGLARNLKALWAKVGGITDIAQGVEGAELFDPGDWAALETSILKWLALGNPRIQLGAEEMRHRYHPNVIARRHLEIYRQVLRSNPGRL